MDNEVAQAVATLQAAVQKAQDLLGLLEQGHTELQEIQDLLRQAEGEAGASQTLTELIGVAMRGLEMIDHASHCVAEIDQTGGHHVGHLSQFLQ